MHGHKGKETSNNKHKKYKLIQTKLSWTQLIDQDYFQTTSTYRDQMRTNTTGEKAYKWQISRSRTYEKGTDMSWLDTIMKTDTTTLVKVTSTDKKIHGEQHGGLGVDHERRRG